MRTAVYCYPHPWLRPSSLGNENFETGAPVLCRTPSPPSTALDDRHSLARILERLNFHSSSAIEHCLNGYVCFLCRCGTPSLQQCLRSDPGQQYRHYFDDPTPGLSPRPANPLYHDFRLFGISLYPFPLALSFSVGFWLGPALFCPGFPAVRNGAPCGPAFHSGLSSPARRQPSARSRRRNPCFSFTSFFQCNHGNRDAAYGRRLDYPSYCPGLYFWRQYRHLFYGSDCCPCFIPGSSACRLISRSAQCLWRHYLLPLC